MAKGISLHVGINKVNPAVFMAPTLKGCVNDATEMCRLAEGFFQRHLLLNEEATFDRVEKAILNAAKELQDGDIFLFTFAGHGTQEPEPPGPKDEKDGKDETLVLYDRLLVDSYLRRRLWSQFNPGVRILGVADSCHSGSAMVAFFRKPPSEAVGLFPDAGPVNAFTPNIDSSAFATSDALGGVATLISRVLGPLRRSIDSIGFSEQPIFSAVDDAVGIPVDPQMRLITNEETKRHRELPQLKEFYDGQKNDLFTGDKAKLKANLLTLAACKDTQKARDGDPHGRFTQALLHVMKTSPGNYDALIKGIDDELNDNTQTPVRFPKEADPTFLAQRPFSI